MQQLSICLHPIEEFNTSGSWPALPVLGARLYAGLEQAETCGFVGPKSGKAWGATTGTASE
jgi:hypothetical protein